MDKLAEQLRADAMRLDGTISDEFERRIEAGLHSVEALPAAKTDGRPSSMWWASSLTGLAAVMAIVLVVNLRQPAPPVQSTQPAVAELDLPALPWKTKPAVLVQPLQQEWTDLKSDIKKAEQVVRGDIDALFEIEQEQTEP